MLPCLTRSGNSCRQGPSPGAASSCRCPNARQLLHSPAAIPHVWRAPEIYRHHDDPVSMPACTYWCIHCGATDQGRPWLPCLAVSGSYDGTSRVPDMRRPSVSLCLIKLLFMLYNLHVNVSIVLDILKKFHYAGLPVPTATSGGHLKVFPTRGPMRRMQVIPPTTPATARKVLRKGSCVLQDSLRAGLSPAFLGVPRRLSFMHI